MAVFRGFPRRDESEYDCFEAGHASTAISAALGFARARDALGQKHHVVAVVGDGALTGGMCYEALNDCGNSKTRLILILNDRNVDCPERRRAQQAPVHHARERGLEQHKKRVKTNLNRIPVVGEPLYQVVHTVKRMVKSVFVDEGFFSALGFRYLGPINGNDLSAVENILEHAKKLDEPVVIHCSTKKAMVITVPRGGRSSFMARLRFSWKTAGYSPPSTARTGRWPTAL